jgi:hypothetical protein
VNSGQYLEICHHSFLPNSLQFILTFHTVNMEGSSSDAQVQMSLVYFPKPKFNKHVHKNDIMSPIET